jgi:L-lactate dehydrogenase complex protein LldG
MSSARDDILAGIRAALSRGALDPAQQAALQARLTAHRRNLVPARATSLDPEGRVDLFVAMAEAAQATVARLPDSAEVPAAVARYLAAENLPAELKIAPDPGLDALPWHKWPLLQIARGRAAPADAVSLTPSFAAIAETGTLMLVSGPTTPTTLNLLPDTHIALVYADQIVATYEDGWDRLRAGLPAAGAALPRTVNFITGPSRTGDIEQQIVLGAHGPRRLHILVVENREDGEDGQASR